VLSLLWAMTRRDSGAGETLRLEQRDRLLQMLWNLEAAADADVVEQTVVL